MKKLFTLLIAFMLALSFNASAGWSTYASITPSVDEPVDQLKLITIDFGHSIGGGMSTKTLNFTTPDGNVKDIKVQDWNPLKIDLGTTYTEPGIYTLSIPKDTFEDRVDYTKNDKITISYTIPLTHTVEPAGGVVNEISEISVIFSAETNFTNFKPETTGIFDSNGNNLINDPATEFSRKYNERNRITFKPSNGRIITEPGVYTFRIPAGAITTGQTADLGGKNNNIEVVYTIEAKPEASLGITAPEYIFKGDVANVTLDLTNGIPFAGFQLDMVLPEGLTVVPPAGAASNFVLSRAKGHEIMDGTVRNTPGAIRLLSYALNGEVYEGSSGTLVTFAVKAEDNFKGDNIAISNIKFADPEGNKYELPNVAAAIESRTYVSSITIAPAALKLETREKAELTVTVAPNDAFNKELEWTSSHPELVKVEVVEGKVVVTALAETGENAVTITATAKDGSKVTAEIPVTVVYTHATALTIAPATVTFEVGNRQTLTATFDKETNKADEIVWTSSNPAVAEIVITEGEVEDVVEVVGKTIGETTVIAQLKNGNEVVLEKTIPVKVDATMATTLAVNPAEVLLETGGQTTLVAKVDDKATDPKISWYVEEGGDQYVSVNENGVVTALAVTQKAVKVYAKTGDGSNLTDFAEVTVVATLVENVTIALADPNDDNQLMDTETVRLVANLTGTTNKKTLWTSSDEAMATVAVVDGVAVVTAGSKTGEVTISATIEGTNICGEYKLTIIPTPATEIAINYDTTTQPVVFETGAGQVALTATVGPNLATDKTYAWTSSDGEIATVNENGVVTFGEKLGVVTITAKANGAAEGQEVKATINFEVVYTLAKTITISKVNEADDFVLKAGESLKLTAKAAPETNKTIRWSSDNEAVTVENGVVTALKYVAGDVTIKAQIFNGETPVVTAQQVITLEVTKGDVNNDAFVTVADVNDVALYIIGQDPEGFIEAAADVNNDGDIDIADVILLVNQILDQDVVTAEQQAVINRARQYADSSNSLFIENFTIAEGETRQIAIMLNNNAAFSAFQADIYLPEGLEFVEATLSDRKADHSLASRVRVDGSVRLLSYSLGVNTFAGSEGELVYMTVKATDNFVGDFQIEIDNIIFVQPNQTTCYLEPTVADVTGYTGVEGVEDDEIVVKVVGNSIVAPEGAEVYDLNGLRVNAENLAKGIYIVKVGNQVVKVII